MGARGKGSNPLPLARKAAANPRIRPRRRREVQLSAIEYPVEQLPASGWLTPCAI